MVKLRERIALSSSGAAISTNRIIQLRVELASVALRGYSHGLTRRSKMALDFLLQTDQEIKHFFDTNWDVPLSEIALMSGRSVAELKQLLLGGSK